MSDEKSQEINDLKDEPIENEEPKRVILPDDVNLADGKLLSLWEDQERYIDHLEAKLAESKDDKKSNDANKREHLLVCRLAIKEQELQELSNQVAELKAAQAPSMQGKNRFLS